MKDSAQTFDLIQMIPRSQFQKLCNKWQMDKGVRSLSTSKLLQVLIFHNLLRLRSLREDEKVFSVAKSTLSDALRKRSSGFFEELCEIVMDLIASKSKSADSKSTLRDLLAIDATEIRTHGSLAWLRSWSVPQGGCGVKLHVVWNVYKNWISDFRVTGYRRNDIVAAKKFRLLPNKIYVFDRAYVDLTFWIKITQAKSDFVTRLKKHPRQRAVWESVLRNVDQKQFGVLWQGEWTPSEPACQRLHIRTKQIRYRHIIYREPEKGRIFDFITSDWSLPAIDIAEIYKKRWAVELLFRWLKQTMDVRSLALRNPNAVRISLDIAVLIQLLMQLNKLIHSFKGTLSELVRVLRSQLYKKSLCSSQFDSVSSLKAPSIGLSTG